MLRYVMVVGAMLQVWGASFGFASDLVLSKVNCSAAVMSQERFFDLHEGPGGTFLAMDPFQRVLYWLNASTPVVVPLDMDGRELKPTDWVTTEDGRTFVLVFDEVSSGIVVFDPEFRSRYFVDSGGLRLLKIAESSKGLLASGICLDALPAYSARFFELSASGDVVGERGGAWSLPDISTTSLYWRLLQASGRSAFWCQGSACTLWEAYTGTILRGDARNLDAWEARPWVGDERGGAELLFPMSGHLVAARRAGSPKGWAACTGMEYRTGGGQTIDVVALADGTRPFSGKAGQSFHMCIDSMGTRFQVCELVLAPKEDVGDRENRLAK